MYFVTLKSIIEDSDAQQRKNVFNHFLNKYLEVINN
jgi:hypothetical protein